MDAKIMTDLHHITRCEYEGSHPRWWVRFQAAGIAQAFYDKNCGGTDAALAAAIAFRDEKMKDPIVVEHLYAARQQKEIDRPRSNNNTGIDAVSFTVNRRRGENGRPVLYVSASAMIEGKNKRRTRSVMCRGAVKALKEVVEWRFGHTGREDRVFSVDMLDFDRLAGWFADNDIAREVALSLDDELLEKVLRKQRSAL